VGAFGDEAGKTVVAVVAATTGAAGAVVEGVCGEREEGIGGRDGFRGRANVAGGAAGEGRRGKEEWDAQPMAV